MRGDRSARVAWLVVAVAAVVAAAVLARDSASGPEVLVADAPEVAAMAPLPGGGLLIGERLTGTIREVDAGGAVRAEPLARLDVSTDGQRGLLGLAVDQEGRTFATWTDPDGILLVGQVAPGPTRLVWRGPVSTDRANGGHLEFAADGRLVLGVGNLLASPQATDPTVPNGKLLLLDPDGPPDQAFEVLSAGWNNPFAFDLAAGGVVWVADNEPPGPERIARGDTARPTQVTELTGTRAPSGLAVLPGGPLAVCGYVSGELEVFETDAAGAFRPRRVLAGDCSLGVVLLADGRLAYSTGSSIKAVVP